MRPPSEQARFEQFFFNEPTCKRLTTIALQFKRPLFLCMPSLAMQFQERGRSFLLFDRDQRFSHLDGYRQFDLLAPFFVEESFDALFVDPPFSNIQMEQLFGAIDTVNGFQGTDHIFICHVREKESAIVSHYGSHGIVRFPRHLGYQTVSQETQRRIFLFGPREFLKYDS